MPLPDAPSAPRGALRWDLFCRVIDNYGDIGTCWRLASQLAAIGDTVRLVADDVAALAWMAPEHTRLAPGLDVQSWPLADEPLPGPAADAVIEAFGCDPPAACVQAMIAADPVWINLEYLSAESHVERSHGLPSPRADRLRKWFFYPGFTQRTGGLLREPALMARRAAFERDTWLAARGWPRGDGERVVSLFCYDGAPVPALLAALAGEPTLLLAVPGPAQRLVEQAALAGARPATLRFGTLPWLAQTEFDQLLWACDVNLVRGEDSLVRALWAGAPFAWQLYAQHDGAHLNKLQAFLDWLAPPADVAATFVWWNGLAAAPPKLPAAAAWHAATRAARERVLAQQDLVTQLRRFVLSHLRPATVRG